eukprot:6742946-Pyramimonas_sp.AAC.1
MRTSQRPRRQWASLERSCPPWEAARQCASWWATSYHVQSMRTVGPRQGEASAAPSGSPRPRIKERERVD